MNSDSPMAVENTFFSFFSFFSANCDSPMSVVSVFFDYSCRSESTGLIRAAFMVRNLPEIATYDTARVIRKL